MGTVYTIKRTEEGIDVLRQSDGQEPQALAHTDTEEEAMRVVTSDQMKRFLAW